MNDATLITEAKKYLDGYHIDLSKYKVVVDRNCGLPQVHFIADAEHKIDVYECYCEGDNIIQAEIYIS